MNEVNVMAPSSTDLAVIGIDHLVLRVGDVDRSADFYCTYLGAIREHDELWKSGDRNFLSLRIGSALLDLTPANEPGAVGNRGVAHICLEVTGAAPEVVRTLLESEEILVESSVSQSRVGARGPGPSLYLTDPDGYRIELKWYTG